MCKRLIVSGTYYRALQRPGVTVVDTPIAEITEDGIRTVDGSHHAVDVIVLATGFDAHAFVRPLQVTGMDGVDLDKAWAGGPIAYRSVALPGFPNFFMMLGPFSPKGNQSLLSAAETQAGYIMRWITTIAHSGARIAVMPTVAATERFLADARAALRHTSWTSGCASYYLGASGSPVLWPWSPRRYRRDLHKPVESDFEFRTI
jgi:cation diffusion facilitator CzcD-associated flavoprotein CzcO